MSQKTLSQLLYSDFDIKNVTVVRSNFQNGNTVSYMSEGRHKNIIHLMIDGERIYRFNGKTLTLPQKSVIFIPDKTRYETLAVSGDEKAACGIGMCFDLVDAGGEKIELVPDIYCALGVEAARMAVADKFYLIEELYNAPLTPVFTMKAQIFRILSKLCALITGASEELDPIKPALFYICEHFRENLPVSQYAKQCNMSESNFRKRFLRCTGMTSIEYRNELRFEEARRLYRMKLSMSEIAERVGFSDAQYLSKLYRRRTGSTLKDDIDTI